MIPNTKIEQTFEWKCWRIFAISTAFFFGQLSCAQLGNLTDAPAPAYDNDPNDLSALQEEEAAQKAKSSENESIEGNDDKKKSPEQAAEPTNGEAFGEGESEPEAKPENFQPDELADSPIPNPSNSPTNPQGISEPPVDPAPTQNLAAPAATPQNTNLPLPPPTQPLGNQASPPASAPPPQNQATPPPPSGTPTTAFAIADVNPTTAVLHWVGYHYQPKSSFIRIEMVTKGNPRYDLFQEKNKKNQHEIVVRYLNTSLRPKIRRDIDASEFLSPVAYIRMRPSIEEQYVDVIITLRDAVKPKLFSKNGNMMLTFAIPDRYFGKSALGQSPIAKAVSLSDKEIFPELVAGSDAPQSYIVAENIPKDPGTQAFEGVPDQAGTPIEPAPIPQQNAALDAQGLPPSFNNAAPPVENPLPVANNSALPANNAQPVGANPLEGSNGTNIPANGNGASNTGNSNLNAQGTNAEGANGQSSNEGSNGELDNSGEDGSGEEPLDDDSLKDFDDGEGDSSNTIEKFDVRTKPEPNHLRITGRWSLFAVAQDNFAQGNNAESGGDENAAAESASEGDFGGGDDFGATTQGAQGSPNSGNGTTSNGGAPLPNNASLGPAPANVPIQATNIPPEPNPALETPPPPATPANQAALPVEPPLAGSPDLTGQEQLGQESGTPPVPTAGGKPTKLDFRQALLSEVMRVLSEETGTNFVIPVDIGQRRVNISMNNIPANDALKAIFDSELLGVVPLAPNLVRVDSLENIARAREEEERRRLAEQRLTPTKILVYRMNYGRATTALPLLREMLSITSQGDNRVGLQVDERTNSIIINAPEPALNMAKALLQRIDLETPQVKIASRIVEVFKTSADNLGISWGGPFNLDQGRGLGFGNLVFPNSLVSRYSVDNGGLDNRSVNFRSRIGSINNGMAFDLALAMEESMGTGEVLQSGNLIVEDNQPATIIAGQSDFFRVAGVNGGGELREVQYNLNMSVTPHITADGAVQMQIRISSDTPRASPGGDAVTARSNRSLNTTLLRRNGETAVIGGIYNTSYNKSKVGVPVLSNLPIIGALFRSSNESDEKRELLVMVTPTIVNLGKQGPGGAPSGGIDSNAVNASTQEGNAGSQLNNGSGAGSQASFSNANFGNQASSGQSQGQQENAQGGLENSNQSGQQNQSNQADQTNQQGNLGQNQEE